MCLWGSAGRAAEVLVQCQAWQPVEHVIVYNVEHVPDAQVEAMMARGREMLATIPGVRRVITGWAVAGKPRYRYCWLIEFAHRAVIDSYREHHLYREFADNLLRPIAVDRVSVDFAHVDAAPSAPVSRVRERATG
jgi:fructose-bisphosphate aldolase class II